MVGPIDKKSHHLSDMKPTPELDVDILRELTNAELLELIELYKSKGDRYHCMSIYNQCRWNKQLNGNYNEKWGPMKKTFYTHRYGNLAANGTYISLQWDKELTIQFHTFEESLNELKVCIVETKRIDWTRGPVLSAIHTHCADEIVDVIKSLGGVFEHEIPCTCFILAHSIALKIQVPSLPEGYELRTLQGNHADFVHSVWAHNDEASVDFIRGIIEFNISLGIFRLTDNQLIAWSLQNELYGLGLLQVIKEEQRKGFGKLLTQAMSKEIAKCDKNDISSFAVVGNVNSENLLMKVGYKKECLTKWFHFKKL